MRYIKSYKIFESDSSNLEYILKELTLPLIDAGLKVQMGYDGGNEYIVLIEDINKIFCKDYPENDMDWLYGKDIISDFLSEIEHHGIKRDIDYKLYGGGLKTRLVFDRKQINKMDLFNESMNAYLSKNAPLINDKIELLRDLSLELSDLGLEVSIWNGTWKDDDYSKDPPSKYINLMIQDRNDILDSYYENNLYDMPEILEFDETLKSYGINYRHRSGSSDKLYYLFDKQGKINKTELLKSYLRKTE